MSADKRAEAIRLRLSSLGSDGYGCFYCELWGGL